MTLQGFSVMFWTLWLRFSTTESKTLQKTPEETYYRQNLGRVSRVQAMDKAQESIVLVDLAKFLSHVHVHLPSQSGQTSYPVVKNMKSQTLACASPVQQA